MRLYHDFYRGNTDDDDESNYDLRLLCDAFCSNDDLDLCDARELGVAAAEAMGTLWRFAPMADSLVEEWHSRDLDSRVTAREAAAVEDWLRNRSDF